MKLFLPSRRVALVALGVLLSLPGAYAYKKGDTAFSKRAETPLRGEPKALAAPVGKADFAEPLTVLEVRGAWLQVKGKKATGWVFEGNLAGEKPTRAPAATLTSIDASKTSTVAAARPLSDAGTAYASRHSAANAGADLDWLEAQAAKVKAEDVETYLRTQQKGEYRP